MDEVMEKYGDIINLPHHKSKKRAPMIMIDRAAQFAPFAALAGHAEAIKEEGRYVQSFSDISEEQQKQLDEKFQVLLNNLDTLPKISITYFVFDDKKDGGEYKTICDQVKKIKLHERQIVLKNGEIIPFDMIVDIGGNIFKSN